MPSVEVLPIPAHTSMLFSVWSGFWMQKDSYFAEVVNSLLTARSVRTVLLAEGGRRLFLKKTSAGESLSELRLLWTCGSERRAFGSLLSIENKVKLVTGLIHVLRAELWCCCPWHLAGYLAKTWRCVCTWQQISSVIRESSRRNHWKYDGCSSPLVSFVFHFPFKRVTDTWQARLLPLPISLDSCLLWCSGSCGALLGCTSFSSGPCLVPDNPSQRAGCALVTSQFFYLSHLWLCITCCLLVSSCSPAASTLAVLCRHPPSFAPSPPTY